MGNRKPEDYLKIQPEAVVETIPAGFSNHVGVSGSLTLTHKDKDGNVKHTETMENVITYSGLRYISQVISGVATTPFKYIQIGTGGRDPHHPLEAVPLPPDPNNTALVAFYKEGIAVTSTSEVLNNADRGYQAIARYAYTFDFEETVFINEACISVDSQIVAGTPILNRRTFYARIMQALDFLEVVWEISFTRYPKDKVS